MNLLRQIEEKRDQLRPSELKVADFIEKDPAGVVRTSIAELAAQCRVSEPTVVRFCKALKCTGFQDFKLKLAQTLASGNDFSRFVIADNDDTSSITRKVFDATIHSLLEVRNSISSSVLDKAIKLLSGARRIEFYGFGASGNVAHDAQHKFFRLQVSASAYSDPHMQSISAATLGKDDAVVAISQTGRTRELLHMVTLARKQGAHVIALCPGDSPLAKHTEMTIAVDVPEDTDIYTPLTSRIVHLTVIDILAMGVARTRGPELAEQLEKVKQNLRTLRITQQ
ncbi:transcriptional regulator HexR [Parendozoicomonas haliclonae]|uniref:transcriptional regulator HexR n=1 Tax=Parendozoicomonas haliclonae TaxID=1960125 RepID=UPI000B35392A